MNKNKIVESIRTKTKADWKLRIQETKADWKLRIRTIENQRTWIKKMKWITWKENEIKIRLGFKNMKRKEKMGKIKKRSNKEPGSNGMTCEWATSHSKMHQSD